jgi:DNA-binding GntR family transcriptional regulator
LADSQPAIWLEGVIPVEDPQSVKFPRYITLAQFVGEVMGDIITHSIATVEADIAPKPLAQRLKMKPGQSLLRLSDAYFTDEGAPVFYSLSYFTPGYIPIQFLRKTDGVPRRGGVSVW